MPIKYKDKDGNTVFYQNDDSGALLRPCPKCNSIKVENTFDIDTWVCLVCGKRFTMKELKEKENAPDEKSN